MLNIIFLREDRRHFRLYLFFGTYLIYLFSCAEWAVLTKFFSEIWVKMKSYKNQFLYDLYDIILLFLSKLVISKTSAVAQLGLELCLSKFCNFRLYPHSLSFFHFSGCRFCSDMTFCILSLSVGIPLELLWKLAFRPISQRVHIIITAFAALL